MNFDPDSCFYKMSELSELLNFLSLESRLDVKCTALEYVLGLTGTQEGKEWIVANQDTLERLFDLLTDSNEIISKDAHLALVNLSAGQNVKDSLVNYIPQLLCYLQNPQWKHADKLCTILSNVSREEKGAEALFKILIKSEASKTPDSRQSFYQLVDIFDQWKSYNEHANFHYLASVFLNLSQISEARQLLLDKSKCILPKLLPYTHFVESHIRRGGIAGLIKNLCFEVGYHKWLLSEEVDLLPSVLLPLAGPEQFEEDEMEKLPEDLQYLPDDKEREPDPDIRKMLLEALMKLCSTKYGREYLREKQCYLILRELHKWEPEHQVKKRCEDVVHILIADEPKSGMENLNEIEQSAPDLDTDS